MGREESNKIDNTTGNTSTEEGVWDSVFSKFREQTIPNLTNELAEKNRKCLPTEVALEKEPPTSTTNEIINTLVRREESESEEESGETEESEEEEEEEEEREESESEEVEEKKKKLTSIDKKERLLILKSWKPPSKSKPEILHVMAEHKAPLTQKMILIESKSQRSEDVIRLRPAQPRVQIHHKYKRASMGSMGSLTHFTEEELMPWLPQITTNDDKTTIIDPNKKSLLQIFKNKKKAVNDKSLQKKAASKIQSLTRGFLFRRKLNQHGTFLLSPSPLLPPFPFFFFFRFFKFFSSLFSSLFFSSLFYIRPAPPCPSPLILD